MKVLFLCRMNSCRSQMAEGVLRAQGGDRFEACSAGAEASSVHPMAIRVMAEAGIDISRHRSKSVDEFAGDFFDYVITVCGDDPSESCPTFTGKAGERLHWGFEDPAGAKGSEEEVLKVFRKVRDAIKERVAAFARETGKSAKRK